MSHRLCIIGGGKMGGALLEGLLAGGWARPDEIVVVEQVEARRHELAKAHPGLHVETEPVAAEGIVIAVKPADVETTCLQLSVVAPAALVVSIAAAIPIAKLETWLGVEARVVRAMPNTPASVGAGAAAIAPGHLATPADMDWAESVLAAVGRVVRVPEHLIDAVTGLSGSGPAYIFLIAEALTDAGVLAGLPHDVSATLAIQTILGAARMLDESGQTPEALRAAVTTPAGTTAAGLRALEARAVRGAFQEAVLAAANRARELGS